MTGTLAVAFALPAVIAAAHVGIVAERVHWHRHTIGLIWRALTTRRSGRHIRLVSLPRPVQAVRALKGDGESTGTHSITALNTALKAIEVG